ALRLRAVFAALACAVGAVAIPTAFARSGVPGCAGPAGGGEWRQYGHDDTNSRHQPLEHTITSANVGSLAPRWVFDDAGTGSFQGTPTVADGCIFVGSDVGFLYALNADSGQVVWKNQLPDPIESTPTVAGGRVFVTVTKAGAPYLAAFSERSG